MNPSFRTGHVALIGRPNAGKSTLLNQILGTKLAITSDKPQTTRNRIAGVHTDERMQAILVDTPGIHSAWTELNKSMVQVSMQVLGEVDVVLLLVDLIEMTGRAKAGVELLDPELEAICEAIVGSKKKTILLLNKVDVVDKQYVLPVIERFNERLSPTATVPISALTGVNVKGVEDEIFAALPVGPPLYPPEQWTQVTERFLAAEVIREKIFHLTEREIPYATAVEILTFDETERETKKTVKIHATIMVERSSQKGILIGKGGSMLKRIGTLARKELMGLLECKVHLELFVKVEADWTRSKKGLKRVGFEP